MGNSMIGNLKRKFLKVNMRSSLAVLVSLAMILTMFPMTAMAAGTENVTTKEDDYNWESAVWAGGLDFSWYDEDDVKTEYHITTPAQWEALAWICSEDLGMLSDYATNTNNNVKAIKGTVPTKQNTFANVKFYLDNDIDMGGSRTTDQAWTGPNYYPIGSQAANDLGTNCFYGLFFGSFDGQGHIVKNIYCKRNSSKVGSKGSESVGLFGRLGAVDNTTYPEADITIENIAASGYIEGYRSTGGIIGKTLHVASGYKITVKNCMNFVDVLTSDGSKGTGGVIGAAWNGAVVENCANFGNVTGGYKTANVGGVNGSSESALSNSYNVGTVVNTVTASNVGAVALNQTAVPVTNCYALTGSAPGYTTNILNGNTFVSGGWKTEAEMKSADFAALLSGENQNAWVQLGKDYTAVSSDVAALAGEYPVPASFAVKNQANIGDISWYNNTDTEFTINTADQLRGFASIVNGTAGIDRDDFSGKTVKLGANIAVAEDGQYAVVESVAYGNESYRCISDQYYITASSADIWTPIGQGEASSNTALAEGYTPFAGTFDGAGYTISGIYTGSRTTDANTATVQGLFGVVKGTVKNVTVSGCITAKMVAAGIAAYLDGGTIENCTNNAIVFIDGGTTPNGGNEDGTSKAGAVGGIAGNAMTNSAISGCTNTAAIICVNSSKGGRSGGILGLIDSNQTVAIQNCQNSGDVLAYQYSGGIVGGIWSATASISGCMNSGKVLGTSSGKAYVGGITGYSSSPISNCYNMGDYGVRIDGATGDKCSNMGGIVGNLSSTVSSCYNAGVNLYSAASSSSAIRSSYGAICGTGYGTADASKLTNCYSLNGTVGEDIDNNCVTVKTAEEMQSADFVKLLNGEDGAWKASNIKTNYGYPVLSWQTLNPTDEGSGDSGETGGSGSGDSGSSSGGSSSGGSSSGGSSSGGGGTTATKVQKPTITAGEGGKTSLSDDGETLTIVPDEGYEISKVTLNGTDKGTADKLTGLKTGDKVVVEFAKKDETPAASFDDVKDSDWFSDAVKYVSENGLMTGTGANTFSPKASTTRGMLMTILARKSGIDTSNSTPWYQTGLDWAVKNGISDGANPDKEITREQLAAMLYRYAGSPQTNGDISKFSDSESVSSYAVDAVKWAVEKGIITGKGNDTLAPKSNAARAEMAAMLQRYCAL